MTFQVSPFSFQGQHACTHTHTHYNLHTHRPNNLTHDTQTAQSHTPLPSTGTQTRKPHAHTQAHAHNETHPHTHMRSHAHPLLVHMSQRKHTCVHTCHPAHVCVCTCLHDRPQARRYRCVFSARSRVLPVTCLYTLVCTHSRHTHIPTLAPHACTHTDMQAATSLPLLHTPQCPPAVLTAGDHAQGRHARAGSPRTVSAGSSVGRVSHPGRPCRRLCLCSCRCRPRPRSQRGGGRKSHAGGRAATGPNQKCHTPVGTRPLCKARTQLGERPKLALFTAAEGRGPSPGQGSEGRAQTCPSRGSSSPESCSPSWGPCRGRPAGPEQASGSPPPLALSQALSVKGEAVASRHISLQQAVVPSVAEHGCF